jgi:peptidoglycan hydrolase CwlO-like protein
LQSKFDNQLTDWKNKSDDKDKEIAALKAEIAKLKAEIKRLKER